MVIKMMAKADLFFLLIPCVEWKCVFSNLRVFTENLLVVGFHWNQVGRKLY